LRRRAPTASPIFSIAAGRPASCACSTSGLGFADFRGNRQYVTLGNLSENPKAYLFLIDHARRQRIKIWGRARVVEGDSALIETLHVAGYAGVPEQALLFEIAAWDANCPQHIPQLLAADAVAAALVERDRRIATLEAEISRLKAAGFGAPLG
jgi:predicted pyridoxine 5'-phosphate oxidase superfamily flavin-nucleotide-binding protein